jgi:peptidoglycan/LPS O-acetylase OafA/YrhL
MRGRLDYVDGLRGLAAIIVVAQHSAEKVIGVLPAEATWLRSVLYLVFIDYVNWGRVGVIAFFCISGFVIPSSFKGEAPVTRFAISRFFRLYPAYWFSLGLAVLLLPIVTGHSFSIQQVAANLTMLQMGLRQPNVVEVYWTLFYELIFYAICVAAVMSGVLKSARYLVGMTALLLAMAMGSAIFRDSGAAIPVGLPLFLAVMHFGAVARSRLIEDDKFASKSYAPILIYMAIIIAPIAIMGYRQAAGYQTVIAEVSATYFGIGLFLAVVHRQWLTSLPLLFLGRISFSVYLLHPIFLELGFRLSAPFPYPYNAIAQVTTTFLCTGVVAWLAFTYIEKPAINLGRWCIDRMPRWA